MAYRAAVIGLGRMGSTFDDEIESGGTLFLPYCHAPSYDAHPRVELVAGADPHGEQRALFGERWGIGADHLYADYRELLARERLDFVSVCTTARVRRQIVGRGIPVPGNACGLTTCGKWWRMAAAETAFSGF